MLKPGDCITYVIDGTKGIVIRVEGEQVYVLWEDYFASREKRKLLQKDEDLTKRQAITWSPYECRIRA